MKKITEVSRKALLELPQRAWNTTSQYDHLWLVREGHKHESGYGLIAIVGAVLTPDGPWGEIAACCDDIMWSFPKVHPYDRKEENFHRKALRMDMQWPSGIVHCWASTENYFQGKFEVGNALSSTEVTLRIEARKGEEQKLQYRMKEIERGER